MNVNWKDYLNELLSGLQKINYIKPYDIPNIDLYMDQVTTFMDEHLEASKRFESDKLLTKTMINNYTKNNLLPSPNKKKYSKDHMYLLVFIYYLKGLLSISDVQCILRPMTEMFYGNKPEKEISLEEIYSRIVAIEEEMFVDLSKDVMKKYAKSKRTFSEVTGEEEKDFLHAFSFISMLSFDVYLKKQMLEKMIDDLLKPNGETQQTESKK